MPIYRENRLMIPEWILQIALAIFGILGAFFLFYLSGKQYHHALWSGTLAIILLVVVIALYIRNDLIIKEVEANKIADSKIIAKPNNSKLPETKNSVQTLMLPHGNDKHVMPTPPKNKTVQHIETIPNTEPRTYMEFNSLSGEPFFYGTVYTDLQKAQKESKAQNKPLLLVIYNAKSSTRSKISYSLGYFMEYETTKHLVKDNFISGIVNSQNSGVSEFIPKDDNLDNCLLVVVAPDNSILLREGVYANPDEGLKRVKNVMKKWESAKPLVNNTSVQGYFYNNTYTDFKEAQNESRKQNKPLMLVIYNASSPQKSKLSYSLGYFMEYETTKNIVRDFFITAIVDSKNGGVSEYIPEDNYLDNCLMVVLAPDNTIIQREGVYANPDEGLKGVRMILEKWKNIKKPA
jgi:hypothetical protein